MSFVRSLLTGCVAYVAGGERRRGGTEEGGQDGGGREARRGAGDDDLSGSRTPFINGVVAQWGRRSLGRGTQEDQTVGGRKSVFAVACGLSSKQASCPFHLHTCLFQTTSMSDPSPARAVSKSDFINCISVCSRPRKHNTSGPSALLSYVSRLDDWILSYSLSDGLPKHMHRESFGREIKTCRLDCLSLNGRNSISYFLITPT